MHIKIYVGLYLEAINSFILKKNWLCPLRSVKSESDHNTQSWAWLNISLAQVILSFLSWINFAVHNNPFLSALSSNLWLWHFHTFRSNSDPFGCTVTFVTISNRLCRILLSFSGIPTALHRLYEQEENWAQNLFSLWFLFCKESKATPLRSCYLCRLEIEAICLCSTKAPRGLVWAFHRKRKKESCP